MRATGRGEWLTDGVACSKLIFRLAQDNELSVQHGLFQRVCVCCFALLVPTVNCSVRFDTFKRLRRRDGKGTYSRRFWSSQWNATAKGVGLMDESVVCSVHCHTCNSLIAHDTHPIAFVESKPGQSTPPVRARKDALQKALTRSNVPAPTSGDMDLESFLRGFM